MSQYFEKLKNVMTREASKSDNTLAQPRWGNVESYDPETNMVQCSFLPEETVDGDKIITNWLHIITPLCGDKWGIVSPLELDDQVIMIPMWNSGTEYVVLGASFNDEDEVAKGPDDIGGEDEDVTIGEYLIRSKSGTTLKFVDENTLMIKGDFEKHEVLHIITKGTDVHITCSDHLTADVTKQTTVNCPNITLNGDVLVTGNLHTEGEIKGDRDITDRLSSMETIREVYDIHIHDDGPPPIPQLPQ